MVRAMILGHEPRQARVAGEAYVRLTLRAEVLMNRELLYYQNNVLSAKISCFMRFAIIAIY